MGIHLNRLIKEQIYWIHYRGQCLTFLIALRATEAVKRTQEVGLLGLEM